MTPEEAKALRPGDVVACEGHDGLLAVVRVNATTVTVEGARRGEGDQPFPIGFGAIEELVF